MNGLQRTNQLYRGLLITLVLTVSTVNLWAQQNMQEVADINRKPALTNCNFPSHKIFKGGNIDNVIPITKVEPNVPKAIARTIKSEANVLLNVLVDRKGDVSRVCVEESPPLLASSAIAAVRQWKFKVHPRVLKSKAKFVEFVIGFTFKPDANGSEQQTENR